MNTRDRRAGFTLIEILVVISITILLLGLILGPVVQTFNLTRRANAMVSSQDTARRTLEQISREIGQAMFVYDNSNSPMNLPIQKPGGAPGTFSVMFGKVDFVLPKLIMHCNRADHPADKPRDYERGDDAWPTCPYCQAAGIACGADDVEARPKQPLAQDTTIVRYFIGLADPDPASKVVPEAGYRDWPENGGPPDNGFILYRAEYTPADMDKLFALDANDKPDMDDPNFFINNWENWKNLAHALPVGPQKDTDLVIIKTDAAATTIASVTPSVRFQLTTQTNDSFEPAFVTDEAADTPAALPTVFRASYGAWGDPNVEVTTSPAYNLDAYNVSVVRYNPANQTNDIYFRAERDQTSRHLVINKYVGGAPGSLVFDISTYMSSGVWSNPTPECAFLVDPSRGQVTFDFPASDVFSNKDIVDMNNNVRNNWGSDVAPPERKHQLFKFVGLQANSDYRPRIVPGSEQVFGPDMTPGLPANQIRMVRYERVPQSLGDPGRNQYKIDYGLNDPDNAEVGWITFSSAPDEAIPLSVIDNGGGAVVPRASTIEISYKFQLNQDGDMVIGNYSTKTLMSITLGIRFYDSNSGSVYPVQLTNKVRVRNLMR